MRQTVVHVPSFEGEYKTGLIFSLIEGLKTDESIKLICDHDPKDLERLLRQAHIPGLRLKAAEGGPGHWSLVIEKSVASEEASHCCGMCGGHKSEGSGG